MFTILLILLILLVGVIGCGLLAMHFLGKKAKQFKWAAWIALVLSCTAVLVDVTSMVLLEPMQTQEIGGCSEVRGEEIDGADRFVDTSANETLNETIPDTRRLLIDTRRLLDRRRLVVVSRQKWVAHTPKSTTTLKHPVEYVIISQTATDACTTQAECTLTFRYLQVFHVEGKKWMDIAYNFMVTGDGQAYEGRGWDMVGAHTAAGFNGISVGISFVGTFSDLLPPPVQIRACKLLIEEGVRLGKISSNYKLIADRQVSQSENPGQKLYEELQTWGHWTAEV